MTFEVLISIAFRRTDTKICFQCESHLRQVISPAFMLKAHASRISSTPSSLSNRSPKCLGRTVNILCAAIVGVRSHGGSRGVICILIYFIISACSFEAMTTKIPYKQKVRMKHSRYLS